MTQLIVLDLETTGIKPENNTLLEVALLPISDTLEPLRPTPVNVLIKEPHISVEQLYDSCDSYVQNLHTSSGLWDELRTHGNTVSLTQADQYFTNGLQHYGINRYNKGILVGSSVHFDRRWIEAKLPQLDSILSYRIVDVTTLLTLSSKGVLPHIPSTNVQSAHRATSDVLRSLKTLQEYKKIISSYKGSPDS